MARAPGRAAPTAPLLLLLSTLILLLVPQRAGLAQAADGIWTSPAELAALPTSGEAWEALLARHGVVTEREDEFTVWRLPPQRHRIAIVAHGGTNAVALAHLLDVRPVPWEWIRFESELAAFSVVQARPLGPDGQVWSLQNFNELDHLRAEGLREP